MSRSIGLHADSIFAGAQPKAEAEVYEFPRLSATEQIELPESTGCGLFRAAGLIVLADIVVALLGLGLWRMFH